MGRVEARNWAQISPRQSPIIALPLSSKIVTRSPRSASFSMSEMTERMVERWIVPV
jgi:hypothetical protein